MNDAVCRVAGRHPAHSDVAFIGLACAAHSIEAEKAGWLVRPFVGIGPCHICPKAGS